MHVAVALVVALVVGALVARAAVHVHGIFAAAVAVDGRARVGVGVAIGAVSMDEAVVLLAFGLVA